MRRVLIVLAVVVLALVGALAAVVAFAAPAAPPHMASVSAAFHGVDFSSVPPIRHFTARDGTELAYRAYPGAPGRVVVLIHGSSGTADSMHAVARAIHAKGATVYALSMRGHDGTGRSGDVDYIGQLDDDLVDFMATLGPRPAGQSRTLLGFSSGGGFALRFAGGPHGALFDRLILVAPQFPYNAPTMRPSAGGWVSVSIPRIVALRLLTRIGITAFNGLPVLAMATNPDPALRLMPVYSFRMQQNFGPGSDYLGDLKRAPKHLAVLAGADDEIFHADKFAPLVKSVRPDASVTIVPKLSHMEMTTRPPALEAIAAAAN
ncbi:MAG: alpha/beta hydrolase [Alphaproteobacteria bacterium]|nr:alpha/beta hydrolase [Alphaproteobacteria bacterium]MBV9420763.1 alpha/beta hydrolase [Alphaproteobacteria bacterium]